MWKEYFMSRLISVYTEQFFKILMFYLIWSMSLSSIAVMHSKIGSISDDESICMKQAMRLYASWVFVS
jgi:hypothetical protein